MIFAPKLLTGVRKIDSSRGRQEMQGAAINVRA
jgi:hypothetical protein